MFEGHPFIFALVIIDGLILICSAIVSATTNDSDAFGYSMLGSFILWVCAGIGYAWTMTLR
jgi:hypothetical protein